MTNPDHTLYGSAYHASASTPFLNDPETQSPVVLLKRRGMPRNQPLTPTGTAGENAKLSASTPPRSFGLWRCVVSPSIGKKSNLLHARATFIPSLREGHDTNNKTYLIIAAARWRYLLFWEGSFFLPKNEFDKDSARVCCQVIYSQFGLAIHQNDHHARRRFVEWAQNEIAVVPDFHKRILFSVEAHLWLNGYLNKQNCRIWSEAVPQVYVETPLHPEKLTVWCVLWAGGIIGPYFFKNDEGHNVTVNGDWYRTMITNFFIPELNNHDVQELWFQQDGATCHTARATIDLL
ncbi:putative DD41D transposase [Trichonephila clavipes]|nr:putative DD41D transposase [Trichonephila clavipes]